MYEQLKQEPNAVFEWLAEVFSGSYNRFRELPTGISTDKAVNILIEAARKFYSLEDNYTQSALLLQAAADI